MNLKSYLFLLLACAFSSTSAQTLKKVFISDTSQLGGFLKEFQQDCIELDYTYKFQGVIEVHIHPFIGGEKLIILAQVLDDHFKNDPPNQFAHFMGKIILIYEFDENDMPIHNRVSPEQIDFLLDEVGDRVFIAQTKVGRWVERYKPDGSIESRNLVRLTRGGGSPFSIVYVIDEKTGKIKKLKTV
ncbi:hypothetical protein [Salmonirosea aquatica]|uniref:Uncharacterized protein n=1 Tax=Salmonirosea aquatica TaxID=2654236 RepID=A0A7C9FCK3_9BACT|nr:hypothetical protein [Cytophagaceae bacterium SJW1-29]